MNYLEIPLDVADVNIKSIEFTEEGEIFITITSTIQGTVCQSCGQKIFDFYGENREITLRHLFINIFFIKHLSIFDKKSLYIKSIARDRELL